MIKCIYTMQKHKKLKTWFDGFIRMKGKKFLLYDLDKVNIYSSVTTALDSEIETAKYLIYVESFEDSSETGEMDEEKTQEGSTERRFDKNKAWENNIKKSKTCAVNHEPMETTDTLRMDQSCDDDKGVSMKPKGRTEEEIISLFK